jgi:cyanophycinase
VPICPEDAAEDLAELTLRRGLGAVPFVVDVHCAQWGTLPRLICAVRAMPAPGGFGIDENTVLIVGSEHAVVRGAGQVWQATGRDGTVLVTALRDGDTVALR